MITVVGPVKGYGIGGPSRKRCLRYWGLGWRIAQGVSETQLTDGKTDPQWEKEEDKGAQACMFTPPRGSLA